MTMTEKVEGRIKHQTKAANKQGRKTNDNTSRDLTTRLKNTILSVDGDYELKTIINFVDNELFAMDSKELRKYINQVIPDVDLSYEFVSEETGERREMQLPIGVGFFWPSSSI